MPRQKGEKINAEHRRQKALAMTIEGHTERAIATALGVSKTQAHKDINKALAERAEEWDKDIDLLRQLQNLRYNTMLGAYWDKAMDGDLEAMRLVLTIMSHLNKLHGLYPNKPLINMSALQVSQNPEGGIPMMEIARAVANGTFGNGHASTSIDSFDGQQN